MQITKIMNASNKLVLNGWTNKNIGPSSRIFWCHQGAFLFPSSLASDRDRHFV